MIPKKSEVLERARALYAEDCYRNGCPELASINPEPSELAESGFVTVAKSELMTNTETKNEQWLNVDYPEDFNVDVKQLFESNALILGSRHTGKSDLSMMIADKCMEKGSIVVCFDPSQDWQNRSSIPSFQTLAIPYIDNIPTESVVYDISLLSPFESQKAVDSFCGKLFRQQAEIPDRKNYLVVFEESHTYFPQSCMMAKAYQNTVKLLSVGRNLGISCLLISQFASMLDKFAIKHSVSQTYLGFTKEFNDLKYLRSLLGSDVKELPKLKDGQFVYLTRNGLSKIAIEPFENNTVKTRIDLPEPKSIEPIKCAHSENTTIALMRFGMLVFFGILFVKVLI